MNGEAPLWLPPGSIRAIIALVVVGAFVGGLIEKDVVLLVLGFYFVDAVSARKNNS